MLAPANIFIFSHGRIPGVVWEVVSMTSMLSPLLNGGKVASSISEDLSYDCA